MSTFTLVSAQATAANNIITLLTEARLLGQYKHTKLSEARESITVVLSKGYAELNRMEKVTGKNMHNVWMAVTQMRGRAKWADHDNMMDILEAALKGFITEYTVETTVETAVETAVELSETVEVVVDTQNDQSYNGHIESALSITTESTNTMSNPSAIYVGAFNGNVLYRVSPTSSSAGTSGRVECKHRDSLTWILSAMDLQQLNENIFKSNLVEYVA